jgi:hypothetical protein
MRSLRPGEFAINLKTMNRLLRGLFRPVWTFTSAHGNPGISLLLQAIPNIHEIHAN